MVLVKSTIVAFCLWQINWLHRICAWLDPGPLQAARILVQTIDDEDMSGEAKRHQVYAALIKHFPGVRKRILAQAIEDAVAELD